MEETRKESFGVRFLNALKYRIRKIGISLYHNPYQVVFVLTILAMGYFTFNYYIIAEHIGSTFLTIGNTVLIFVWTLFAYLSCVSYLFYMGKKKNWIMFGVYIVMMISQIIISVWYKINAGEEYLRRLNTGNGLDEEVAAEALKVLNDFTVCTVLLSVAVVGAVVAIVLDNIFKKQRKAKYEAKKAAKANEIQ